MAAVALLAAAILAQAAIADVLIDTRGKRWEGKVRRRGDTYVVERPGGGRMTFPRSMVKRVITSKEVGPQFDKMVAAADLTSDAQLQALMEFAKENGLTEEAKGALVQAFRVRRSAAKDKRDALRALRKWCEERGLESQRADCELALKRIDFEGRLAEAKDGPLALARLARWCRDEGLGPEAKKMEDAALKMAPDDPEIRRQLRYVRDDATGKWVRVPPSWRVALVSASLGGPFREKTALSDLLYRTRGKDKVLASVTITFEALSAEQSPWRKRVPEWAQDWFMIGSVGTDNLTKPSRLFQSSCVPLVLADNTQALPGLTSSMAGPGYTADEDSTEMSIGGDRTKVPDVLYYVRRQNLTVALVRPHKAIRVTLLYTVPEHTRTVKLKFYDLAPIEVRFGSR